MGLTKTCQKRTKTRERSWRWICLRARGNDGKGCTSDSPMSEGDIRGPCSMQYFPLSISLQLSFKSANWAPLWNEIKQIKFPFGNFNLLTPPFTVYDIRFLNQSFISLSLKSKDKSSWSWETSRLNGGANIRKIRVFHGSWEPYFLSRLDVFVRFITILL